MKLPSLLLALALGANAGAAYAGATGPYDQRTFDTLAASGKPVIVAVTAAWCTTCKAQKPIEDALLHAPAYRDVDMMVIDFDSAKALLARYHVSMQSTLIAFKGGRELGRSVGDTSAAGIAALFKKTLD